MTELLFRLDGARTGPGATAVEPAWLWVRNGRVLHLGPNRPTHVPGEVVPLTGGWAIEPLADAHVHLCLSGTFDPARRAATADLDRDGALQRILDLLGGYRSRGVAAVRDGGDPHGLALEAAQVANRHLDRYAAVLPAGEPVFRRGGYGGFLGRGVESLPEALRLLETNRARGATHAKLLATGLNSLDTPGAVGPPRFTPGELKEIITGCRDLGLPAMVHANGPLGDVLAAAPGSVEHGFWLEEQDLDVMAAQGVTWVPTLAAWARLGDHPGLTAAQKDVVTATDHRHREDVARGFRLGVPLAAGSDAGTPGVDHDGGLVDELRRLAGAGVSAPAALATATCTARRLCQAESAHTLGSLSPGEPAGFLWLGEDPVRHPETLTAPLGVFLGESWSPAGGSHRESWHRSPGTKAEDRY